MFWNGSRDGDHNSGVFRFVRVPDGRMVMAASWELCVVQLVLAVAEQGLRS